MDRKYYDAVNGNRYLYNGKEKQFDLSDQYDYGARFYDPVIARWGHIDPKAELYFQITPYAYAANTPTNAIDPNGHLVIFINGQHGSGTGGNRSYWQTDVLHYVDGKWQDYSTTLDFAQAVEDHFHDHHERYYDGAMGGWGNTFWSPSLKSNLYVNDRIEEGYSQGQADAASVIENLAKTNGVITESIKVVAHSMGAVYSKGYIKALVEYARAHPEECRGLVITEYDFAAYQQNKLSAIPGVTLYQFDNQGDNVVGNGITSRHAKEKGREEQGNNDDVNPDGGHSITDFMEAVSGLQPGVYKYVNGKFVKQQEKK